MTHIWFISLVLVTLGQRLYRKPRAFTVAELFAWAPELQRMSAAHRACTMLAQRGFLEPAPSDDPRDHQITGRPAQWQMTEMGREAARSAQLGAAAAKRSETLAGLNASRRYPDSLTRRLWTVLVARRVLTAAQAVDVLGDAGEDTSSLRTYISNLLLHWHTLLPNTVQVSARRVGGCKQYVLVGDVGRLPPDALRNAPTRAKAAREATA